MCLTTERLNMVYCPEENDFIGTGYKVIKLFDKLGRLNLSKSKIKTKWTEAVGNWDEKKFSSNRIMPDIGINSYWPGFHIFLNLEDAIKYSTHLTLVEVKYKSVTGFGNNQTEHHLKGPCVIARYAKISKIISLRASRYNQNTVPYKVY